MCSGSTEEDDEEEKYPFHDDTKNVKSCRVDSHRGNWRHNEYRARYQLVSKKGLPWHSPQVWHFVC